MIILLLILVFQGQVAHSDTKKTANVVSDNTSTGALQSLIAGGLERNPELIAFQEEVAGAKGQVLTANTWDNPDLSVGPGIKRLPSSGEDSGDRFFKGSLELSQKILFPGKRSLQIAIAEKDVKAGEIALEGMRSQITFKISKVFYELLASKEIAALREMQVQSAKTFFAATQKKAKSGYGSDFEVIKGEAELITAEKLLRDAQTKVAASRIELNTLLARDSNEPIALSGNLEDFKLPLIASNVVDLALTQNPSLKVQLLHAEKAGLSVQAAELSKNPNVSVGPFVEYGRDEQVYGVGISLPLPLWDSKKGVIDTANAEQRKELAEVQKLKLELTQAVSTSLENFNSSRDQLSLYSPDFLKRLKNAMEQAEKSYETNGTTLLIFLDAKRTYFDSFADYYESISKLSSSYSELQSAVGVSLDNK